MDPLVEAVGSGSYIQESFAPSSSDSAQTPKASAGPVPALNTSASLSQVVRVASASSPVTSSRSSGRSRRGCITCRKRKVKCNEGRPTCGHCSRLQLPCSYEPRAAEPHHTSPRQYKSRNGSALPERRQSPVRPGTLPQPRQQSSAVAAHHGVNPSRARSISCDTGTMQDYDASMIGNIIPSVNSAEPVSDQVAQQRLLGPDTWELELLGEDSLWANLPILSNFISVKESPPYTYVPSYAVPSSPIPPTTFHNSKPPMTTVINGIENTISTGPIQNSSHFLPTDEITLLRHFVDFAVPPILVGVEPRWSSSRDALLRLSKSNLPLRHAICAFSALSLGESSGSMSFGTAQPSTFYTNLAMNELRKILDEQSLPDAQSESHESILASIFFLSYVELIVSNTPNSSLELLNRAHTLMSNKKPPNSALYQQLQIWLKLLDAKVVSAGSEGIHLHTSPETRDLEAVRESYGSLIANDDQNGTNSHSVSILETEEILFNSLNRQAYNFYIQILNFSSRIARLDKWHRSRGSVQDELEVMLAANKIMRDLNALWTRRPAIIDLADKSEQLRQDMSNGLASKVEQHLRTYTANFHACFIHLQRVAYAHLRAIPQVKTAVSKIVHFSRLTTEDGHALPVSMLWPLMMAGCEAEDEETQVWIIGTIEEMKGRVGNAMRAAGLLREIMKRQRTGQRADARTVMQETFGLAVAVV